MLPFNLVYHDAMLVNYAPDDLRGFLNAGLPSFGTNEPLSAQMLANVRRMAALNKRLARQRQAGDGGDEE